MFCFLPKISLRHIDHTIKSELRSVCKRQWASLEDLLSYHVLIFSSALHILTRLSPWNCKWPSCLSTHRVSHILWIFAPSGSSENTVWRFAEALANATIFFIVPVVFLHELTFDDLAKELFGMIATRTTFRVNGFFRQFLNSTFYLGCHHWTAVRSYHYTES